VTESDIVSTLTDPNLSDDDKTTYVVTHSASLRPRGNLIAKLSRGEFHEWSVAACRAALDRLDAQQGSDPKLVFAATGEVLFWLYAIGDRGWRDNRLFVGFQWVRNMHAHGNLLAETVYVDPGATLDRMRLDPALPDALPELRWLPSERIATLPKALPFDRGKRAYDNHIKEKPVVATLRKELARLATSPA
jgi:hypothetical protein